ncbi:MAG: iron complex outermembrane receptor protein [Oceanicoccus sp.]|jgi:iron complex outermembrane receptor protein
MNNLTLNAKPYTPAIPALVVALCSTGGISNATAASEAGSAFEEILITARKRPESSLDVPIALSVFDQTILKSPLIDNISTLGALSPNVDFSHTTPLSGSTNSASVFIRGVGQNDFLLTTDPGVGIYLDGVYISRSIGGVLQLTDVERVEILRGPQGTLFGKNTIGGAVQVISRKPTAERTAHISATTGKFNRQDIKASIEGSITDQAQARISVQSERRDGYAERLLDGVKLGDIDRLTIGVKLVWQSSENTEWDLSFDHTHQRQEAIAQTILELVPTPISGLYNALVAAPQGTAWDERWITGDPFTTYQTGPSQDDSDISGASVKVKHSFSAIELTSITGYRRLSADYARDPDNSPLQYGHSINHDEHKQFSQEVHLSGSAMDQRLDWLTGIYYFREHGENLTEGFLFSGLYQATGNNPMFDADFNVNNDIITDSRAVFTQLTGHLTDKLNVTAGLRYSREEKEFSVDNFTLNAGIQIVGPTTVDDSWNNSSPMLSIDYHINDDTMTYFTASKGFKSGGFNGRQIFPGPIDRFDPEFATSYELGLKTRIKPLGANLAAAIFSVDYKDMQFTTLTGTSFGLLPLIDNAAKADIDGIELSLIRSAKQGISFNTGIGYLHARYTDVEASSVITGDEDLVRTPEWNAHLQLAYNWQIADAGSINLSGFANYKSKIYHDPTNEEALAEDDLTLVNASLGWTSQQAAWQIEIFVTNLTDEIYLLSGSTEKATFGGTEGHFARPREWGLRATANF